MFGRGELNVTIELRPARQVARRALCLATLVMRGEIEHSLSGLPAHKVEEMTHGAHLNLGRRMLQWLENEGIFWDLSLSERRLMDRAVGEWSTGDSLRAIWRQESLAVLLWALGSSTDLPPYDRMADQEALLKGVPINRPTADFLQGARLRPAEEVGSARQCALAWHVRSRAYEMAADPLNYPSAGLTLDAAVAVAAEEAERQGFFHRIDADFPAHDKPYRELEETNWQVLHSIALERHHALNWLCGLGEDWDNVPTDR